MRVRAEQVTVLSADVSVTSSRSHQSSPLHLGLNLHRLHSETEVVVSVNSDEM